MRLLDRVQHRSVRTRSEIEAVDWIRREAASRRGIDPRAEHRLDKALDHAPDTWVTATFIDGELASTLRIRAPAKANDRLPSANVFSDGIEPYLQKGAAIIDTSQLAVRLEYAQRFPEMPYVAQRPAWLAGEHFDADFIVATIFRELQPFYQRVFGYEPWRELRPHPDFDCDMCCMRLDFRAAKQGVEASHPFLRSSQAERDALFRRSASFRAVLAYG